MTLTIAIVMSLIVSLTTTPTICAYLPAIHGHESAMGRASRRAFAAAHRFYDRTMTWALDNPGTIMVILAVTVGLNIYCS